jgi:hypothetical protein
MQISYAMSYPSVYIADRFNGIRSHGSSVSGTSLGPVTGVLTATTRSRQYQRTTNLKYFTTTLVNNFLTGRLVSCISQF